MQITVWATSGGHWLDVMEALVSEANAKAVLLTGAEVELSLVSVERHDLALTREQGQPVMYEYAATFEVVGRRA